MLGNPARDFALVKLKREFCCDGGVSGRYLRIKMHFKRMRDRRKKMDCAFRLYSSPFFCVIRRYYDEITIGRCLNALLGIECQEPQTTAHEWYY